MKKYFILLILLCAFTIMFVNAKLKAETLEVSESHFCYAVEGGKPKFESDNKSKIYFWTKIEGAEQQEKIKHKWYYNGKFISQVTLNIKYKSYRTWSYKTIPPDWSGSITVKVLDSKGNELKTAKTEISRYDKTKIADYDACKFNALTLLERFPESEENNPKVLVFPFMGTSNRITDFSKFYSLRFESSLKEEGVSKITVHTLKDDEVFVHDMSGNRVMILERETPVETGKRYGADYVVFGWVESFVDEWGKEAKIYTTMVSVKTASITGTSSAVEHNRMEN